MDEYEKENKTMRELTIITTMEVTKIYKNVPEDFENDNTRYGEGIKNKVKDRLDADDVVVTNVQVFERTENEKN